MKNIIAIGASNSRQSINQQLAFWAANQLDEVRVELLDLNDYEMPIYSIDRENQNGIPQQAQKFKEQIYQSDGIVLSLAEHNGSYTAAFKNITDWVSRLEKGTWANKPLLLMATSPGPRGGKGVLDSAKMTMPYQGAQLSGVFSLPVFNQNFDSKKGIIDAELKLQFTTQLELFKSAIINEKTNSDHSISAS